MQVIFGLLQSGFTCWISQKSKKKKDTLTRLNSSIALKKTRRRIFAGMFPTVDHRLCVSRSWGQKFQTELHICCWLGRFFCLLQINSSQGLWRPYIHRHKLLSIRMHTVGASIKRHLPHCSQGCPRAAATPATARYFGTQQIEIGVQCVYSVWILWSCFSNVLPLSLVYKYIWTWKQEAHPLCIVLLFLFSFYFFHDIAEDRHCRIAQPFAAAQS